MYPADANIDSKQNNYLRTALHQCNQIKQSKRRYEDIAAFNAGDFL
jgi:hypothetical protein